MAALAAASTTRPVLAAKAPKAPQQSKALARSGFSAAVAPATVHMRTRTVAAADRRQTVQVVARYEPTNMKWGSHRVDEYPSPEWIEFCKEEFKNGGEGMSTLEESRTLFSEEIGYKLLDVRSDYERETVGKVAFGCIYLPLINVKKRFDSTVPGNIALDQTPNPDFIAEVQKRVPDKGQGIVIMCSDSLNRSVQAAIMLDEVGYTNLTICQWGYNGWCNKFSNKLLRRRSDGYKEDYSGAGSDSAGIHSSGAGFARMDAIEKIQIKDQTEWMEYRPGLMQ